MNNRYSLDRREKKLAGVCSTIGDIFNVDPTIVRIGFIAIDPEGGGSTAVLEHGSPVTQAEMGTLMQRFRTLLAGVDLVLVGGSVPHETCNGLYRQVLDQCALAGLRKARREVDRGRRLADTALLVREREDLPRPFGHDAPGHVARDGREPDPRERQDLRGSRPKSLVDGFQCGCAARRSLRRRRQKRRP